jgi:serine/threonine protein kinase
LAPPATLAVVLAMGPLPLGAGLRCAGEIAAELRDLHQQTRAYGRLTASSILMTASGARLLPPPDYWDRALPQRDVEAFGAVLYQMLTGAPPPVTLTAADSRVHAARTGTSRLRTAAMKLALKCLAPKGTPMSMQQVATELRLLGLLLRQHEANTRHGREPAAAAPAPMLPLPGRAPSAGEIGAAPLVPLGPDSFGHPKPKAKPEPQPAGGNCPKCNSAGVYSSRARSRFELMLERWGVPICRCHRCYHRYVVLGRFKIGKEMPVGAERPFKPKRRRK